MSSVEHGSDDRTMATPGGASVPSVDQGPQLSELVAAKVAAGRLDGTYPAGLEDELDEHWRRVVGRPSDAPLDRVHRALDGYIAGATFSVPTVEPTSGVPGGSALHKLVGKTVTRHLSDLVLQLDEFARSVQEMFSSIVAVLDDVPAHTHTQLVGQLESMEGSMASMVRTVNALASSADDSDPGVAEQHG
jgi:hypothetical protein